MEKGNKTAITVETKIKAPLKKVWDYWTGPKHITKWCQASDDWHVPFAENDLQPGGKFRTTMAAKDSSMSFDFEGVYSDIKEFNLIEYSIIDGRKVKIIFTIEGSYTKIIESFEAENVYSLEQQKDGWQSILDNFKKYTEEN